MLLYFNQTGQLLEQLTHGNAARVGSTSYEIFAYFGGIDLSKYSAATIRFQKPDLEASEFPTLFMVRRTKKYEHMPTDGDSLFQNGQEYTGFSFNFTSFMAGEEAVVLLDTPGLWYASITLISDNSERNVTGIVAFNVERAVSSFDDEEAQVTLDNLVDNIAMALTSYLTKSYPTYFRVVEDFDSALENNELDIQVFVPGAYFIDMSKATAYRIDSVTLNPLYPEEIANITKTELGVFVTKDIDQVITGQKTFTKEVFVTNGSKTAGFYVTNTTGYLEFEGKHALSFTKNNIRPHLNFVPGEGNSINLGSANNPWVALYLSGSIYYNSYTLDLPNKNGTLALTSDIANLRDKIAPLFNSSYGYSAGDLVFYNNILYKALQKISSGPGFIENQWEAVVLSQDITKRLASSGYTLVSLGTGAFILDLTASTGSIYLGQITYGVPWFTIKLTDIDGNTWEDHYISSSTKTLADVLADNTLKTKKTTLYRHFISINSDTVGIYIVTPDKELNLTILNLGVVPFININGEIPGTYLKKVAIDSCYKNGTDYYSIYGLGLSGVGVAGTYYSQSSGTVTLTSFTVCASYSDWPNLTVTTEQI